MTYSPITALVILATLGGVSSFALVGSPTLQPRMAVSCNKAFAGQAQCAVPAASVRSPAPLMMSEIVNKETNARSAVKAIGWRITAGIVTAITSYIFTQSLAMAASIVGWDLCSKSVTMFIGERLWNNVQRSPPIPVDGVGDVVAEVVERFGSVKNGKFG